VTAARAALLLLALAGCDPRGAQFQPSPAALAAPRPELVATGRFRAAQVDAPVAAARLEADSAALAARAEALRARARALDAPVLEPDERGRLDVSGG
jgi:hypothetical protein